MCTRAHEVLASLAKTMDIDLRPEDSRAITRLMMLEQFRDGETFRFNRAGPMHGRAMLVLHGEVNVQLPGAHAILEKDSDDDQPKALSSSVGEGGFLGLLTLFGGAAGSMLIRPCGPVVAASMTRAALAQLMRDSPSAAAKLYFIMMNELAIVTTKYVTKIGVMDSLARGMQMEMLQPSMLDPAVDFVLGRHVVPSGPLGEHA